MDDATEIKMGLADADGTWLADVRAILSGSGDECVLTVFWPEATTEQKYVAADFYECLRSFRRVLDPHGIKVLCEGARPKVFPSPLARAGGALKAYALTLGEQALSNNLVNVFDPVVNATDVGSVAEQEAFVERHKAAFRAKFNASQSAT